MNINDNVKGKKYYYKLSSDQFLKCLTEYVLKKYTRIELYNLLQQKIISDKKMNIEDGFNSNIIYYHRSLETYNIGKIGAFRRRIGNDLKSSPLCEVYLIMELIDLKNVFYVKFKNKDKQNIYNGLMNETNLDLWTKLRMYFEAEDIPRNKIKELLTITNYVTYRKVFKCGQYKLSYYEKVFNIIGAKLTCMLPENMVLDEYKNKAPYIVNETNDIINYELPAELEDSYILAQDQLQRLFDYAYKKIKEENSNL